MYLLLVRFWIFSNARSRSCGLSKCTALSGHRMRLAELWIETVSRRKSSRVGLPVPWPDVRGSGRIQATRKGVVLGELMGSGVEGKA
jgi:hypothetical protein